MLNIVAFIVSLAVAAALTPLIRGVARQLGALDHAHSSRKVHARPVPRLGGVAIVTAFYVAVTGLLLSSDQVTALFRGDPRQAIGIFVGGSAIAALGLWDDLWGTGARTKFAVQFAVAGCMYWFGYRIDGLTNPFGAPIELGWLGLPVTVLWIAGVVNAMNLIDGLDGLAGGVALISIGVIFALSLMNGEPLMALLAAALGGAVLGFLRYNFNPASIFMGDTGSMFLGFVLAIAAIAGNQKSSTVMAIAVPVVALGVPIADTLLAMTRRAIRGAPLFRADRDHIHHRLLGLGLTHRQAVLAIYAASVVLGVAALAVAVSTEGQGALILAALAILVALLLRRLGYLRIERAREALDARRQNLARRVVMRTIAAQLSEAASAGEVWEAVRRAAGVVGAAGVALELAGRGPDGARVVDLFEHGTPQTASALVTRHAPLGGRPRGGAIALVWPEGRASIDRDSEIAIEMFCEDVGEALQRVEDTPAALVAASGELQRLRLRGRVAGPV
jgi:UDP-GlcNAc:undecaprenyl-phosphate GlcNAc-1-phosphate transferase